RVVILAGIAIGTMVQIISTIAAIVSTISHAFVVTRVQGRLSQLIRATVVSVTIVGSAAATPVVITLVVVITIVIWMPVSVLVVIAMSRRRLPLSLNLALSLNLSLTFVFALSPIRILWIRILCLGRCTRHRHNAQEQQKSQDCPSKIFDAVDLHRSMTSGLPQPQ